MSGRFPENDVCGGGDECGACHAGCEVHTGPSHDESLSGGVSLSVAGDGWRSVVVAVIDGDGDGDGDGDWLVVVGWLVVGSGGFVRTFVKFRWQSRGQMLIVRQHGVDVAEQFRCGVLPIVLFGDPLAGLTAEFLASVRIVPELPDVVDPLLGGVGDAERFFV